MHVAKIALLAVVALLLAVVIIDRHREADQIKRTAKAIEDSRTASGRAESEAQRARQDLAQLQQQVAEVRTGTQQLRESIGGLSAGIAGLSASIARLATAPVVMTGAGGGVAATGYAQAPIPPSDGSGEPKLGVNFLRPYDRSHLDPARIGGTLRTFSLTPKGFNPIIDNSAESADVDALANDTLATTHPADPERWSQSLATSVVISDDWTTFTFSIRPGVVWQTPAIASQGEFAWLARDHQLSAKDVAFFLEMARHPDVEAPHLKAYYADLDRVETPDDRTLILRWKKKSYTNLSSSLGLTPLPRHIYAMDRTGTAIPAEQLGRTFNKHWFDELNQYVGVGAYRVVHILPDRELRFERFPSYWGASLHPEAIRWDAEVRQPDPQLTAFKNGQVQAHGLTPSQYRAEILDRKEPRFAPRSATSATAGRSGQLAWEQVTSRGYQYIGWNTRRALFRDRRVRHALAHAFPKQRILTDVYQGLGRAQIGPVHLDHPAFNRTLVDFAYDPARARALLAEAGWRDRDGDGTIEAVIDGATIPFRFTLLFSVNSTEDARLADIYRQSLGELGIELEAKGLEWKDLLDRCDRFDFDAIRMGWRLTMDLDFHQLWHSSSADEPRSSNLTGFRSTRVDELSERLRETFDLAGRTRIAQEIQALIFAEQTYLFVRCPDAIFVWNPALVDGVAYGLDRYHRLYSRDQRRWVLTGK